MTTSVEVYQNTLFTLADGDTANPGQTSRPVSASPLLVARSEAEAVSVADRRTILVLGGRADNKEFTKTVQAGL